MTTVARADWEKFQDLPGAATANFEALCRALVRLHYGRFGIFRATAQMPGIEFHLRLSESCAIGKKGDWIGWQCRWYGTGRGQSLGTARRSKIIQAIRTSEKTMPGLTDWVLWTRHPLTAGDDKWYHSIRSKVRLHTRDSSYVEELLCGDGLMLRATYFGEWVFRPETLAERHQQAVSSIHTRWLPHAHQEVDAERTLRRALGDAASWNAMLLVAEKLETSARGLRRGPLPPGQLALETRRFASELDALATVLRDGLKHLLKGDFDLLKETLEHRPKSLSPDLTPIPRRLRGLRLYINFYAANGIAFHQDGRLLLDEMHQCLAIRLFAVMADAGGGKTQLAAELTAPRSDRPAGVLLHGRSLKAGGSLNDLAGGFVVDGRPMPSFEAIVAALDAASQRSRRRLPIVIDGLNEAEDPRNWKQALSEADTLLKNFPGVLLIVTLRTGGRRASNDNHRWEGDGLSEKEEDRAVFARIALPENTPLLEMDGFGEDTRRAIARYFRHFQIKASISEVPTELLSHPLTLRIFCEVTNPPPQKHEVGPEALPRSLVQLFERYISRAVERIATLSPKSMAYSGQDIRRALNQLGIALWDENRRELDQDAYRVLIGDAERIWDHSLIKLMEQEGLILRVAKTEDGKYGIIPVYDAIGGYLVVNALLAKMNRVEFIDWIQRSENIARLSSDNWETRHPMAADILKVLVALIPRRFQQEQFWTLVPEAMRLPALFDAINLEGDLIDSATVEEISKIVRDPMASGAIFDRLARTRAIPNHPFNSIFVDTQLRGMKMADRDLRWTETIRKNYERDSSGMPRLGAEWENESSLRSESEALRARWMMWLLTSTAHEIRLKATRALYWFGSGDPQALFALTTESLSINDPYVSERMLAASYGVVMNRHGAIRNRMYEITLLKSFARSLYEKMFAPGAPHATTHILAREYACRIVDVARQRNKGILTVNESKRTCSPFPRDLHPELAEFDVEEDGQIPRPSPLRMDFENYTLGRLVRDRGNYDFKHPEYRKVLSQVLGRIAELGWTSNGFAKIDDGISSEGYRSWRNESPSRKIDRYGKKYSWIAYLEQKGRRVDLGLIAASHREYSDRSSEVDIDPSFPRSRAEEQISSENWLSGSQRTLPAWISRGPVPNTIPILLREEISGEKGPWRMLDGYFTQQDKITGRDMFCFVRAFLTSKKQKKALVMALRKQSMKGRWLPEKPSEIYAYAGEFPWCSSFERQKPVTMRFVTKRWTEFLWKRRTDRLAIMAQMRRTFELMKVGDGEAPAKSAEKKVKSKLVKVEVPREEASEFKVIIPVCDFHWEGPTIDEESESGVLLAKHIAEDLKLRWIPGTLDLAGEDGRCATIGIGSGGESRDNRQQAFYIREELLKNYLRRTDQALIWVTWGERGIAHHLARHVSRDREKFGVSFKVFHRVTVY